MTFADLRADLFNTHVGVADRILPSLLLAVQQSPDPLVRQAAGVLQQWDRATTATSRGAVLFATWLSDMQQFSTVYATPFDPQQPLTTPHGLAHPEQAVATLAGAAQSVQQHYGTLDVPWGTVYRLRGGAVDLPASGGSGASQGLGVFRAVESTATGAGTYQAVGGDTFMLVVDLATPIQAHVLWTYGNASQPVATHHWDQVLLFAHDQLREVWLDRSIIEQHLEARERF